MKKLTAFLLVVLMLSTLLAGCDSRRAAPSAASGSAPAVSDAGAPADSQGADAGDGDENTLTDEQMEQIKYNYYASLNNDIYDIWDSLDCYFSVVADDPEFSLLPDTGLPYGFRIYGKNTDILDDCVALAGMEPDFGEIDALVQELEAPLRTLMETFSAISRSSDYADNQYAKAKEWHAAIYEAVDPFLAAAPGFLAGVAQMGRERIAAEEAKMLEEGNLIIYNASHAITIGQQIVRIIAQQEVTDETLSSLDLTEIYTLYDELVETVAAFDAATSDNDQLIRESLSNSRPFDGLFDSLIQALEWMIRQVESGRLPDMSGSGAPLGSIGHFSEVLSTCIERYNSVFVE